MKTQSLLATALLAATALYAPSLSAADARLQQLADQLRGRTARLVFEVGGLFGDAANFEPLSARMRAMHDTAESLSKTSQADVSRLEHLDKDLAALAHYRVQFSKEFDVLQRELEGLWRDAYRGSFVEEDVRIVRSRLAAIERVETALNRHLHPELPAALAPVPDLSSRPDSICPRDVGGVRPLPEGPLPADPRPVDPLPLPRPEPGSGGPAIGPAPIPEGVLPRPRIPGRLDPGRGIPGLDLGRRIPLPTGSGAGAGGSGGPAGGAGTSRIPGVLGDALRPGVRDILVRDGVGSRPGSDSGTGTSPRPGGTLIPGTGRLGGIGAGGIPIPIPRP